MSIAGQLHKSKAHREGFDPSCPQCVKDGGLTAIITHLRYCATQNEKDAKASAGTCPRDCAAAGSVAAEQRRMIGILQLAVKS